MSTPDVPDNERVLTAFVSWPAAPLTDMLVRRALASLDVPTKLTDNLPATLPSKNSKLLQWSTYDALSHDFTLEGPTRVLSSSYTIRKALIRKHFLSRCISSYTTKHPESGLKTGIPRTWELELSFADELDEKWADELWDLGAELEKEERKWYILKPGMADRGNGIRLFDSKNKLQSIFEEFEADTDSDDSASDDPDDEDGKGMGVLTSQLRHFVIQEYLSSPVLIDPFSVPLATFASAADEARKPAGHKFHLRAYCVARGALQVYLYTQVLALFSSAPYVPPGVSGPDADQVDLTPHLTNTCLQPEHSEEHVRLLDELVWSKIWSSSEGDDALTEDDVKSIKGRMGEILKETFQAALEMPVHFQPLPNAYELFGVDFLISHPSDPSSASRFAVSLLEMNAEPAIEMTGPRLTWILEGLFEEIAKVCVLPFFDRDENRESEGKCGLKKVLDVEVRGSGGW